MCRDISSSPRIGNEMSDEERSRPAFLAAHWPAVAGILLGLGLSWAMLRGRPAAPRQPAPRAVRSAPAPGPAQNAPAPAPRSVAPPAPVADAGLQALLDEEAPKIRGHVSIHVRVAGGGEAGI